MLNNKQNPATALFWEKSLQRQYGHSRRHDLERILRVFSPCTCGDPRDKIFGLLGLFEDSKIIEVDYNKTVAEVLIETVSVIVRNAWEVTEASSWPAKAEELSRLCVQLTRDMGLWEDDSEINGRRKMRTELLCGFFRRWLNTAYDVSSTQDVSAKSKPLLYQSIETLHSLFRAHWKVTHVTFHYAGDGNEQAAGLWYGAHNEIHCFSLTNRLLIH